MEEMIRRRPFEFTTSLVTAVDATMAGLMISAFLCIIHETVMTVMTAVMMNDVYAFGYSEPGYGQACAYLEKLRHRRTLVLPLKCIMDSMEHKSGKHNTAPQTKKEASQNQRTK